MELSIQERLKDLRESHRDDFFSVSEQASLAFICKRLLLNYKKLSEEKNKWLKRISEKSDLLKIRTHSGGGNKKLIKLNLLF